MFSIWTVPKPSGVPFLFAEVAIAGGAVIGVVGRVDVIVCAAIAVVLGAGVMVALGRSVEYSGRQS